MKHLPILAALLVAALSPSGGAHGGWLHCGANETLIDADQDGYPEAYVVIDVTSWAYLYMESNGIPDLQRGFAGDTCDEGVPADYAVLLL